jgi:hypothetical protein
MNEKELEVQEESLEIEEEVVESEEVAQAQPQEADPVETSGQKNYRMLREKAERAERERDQIQRERDEAMAILRNYDLQQKQLQASKQEEEDDYLDDDLKKLDRKITKIAKAVEYQQARNSSDELESRLQRKYPDIMETLSTSNISALRRENPGLAQLLYECKDDELKATETYKAVKKMQESSLNYQNSALAKNNMQKPRSVSSVAPQSNSPLTQLTPGKRFSPSDMDSIREQTLKYISNKNT